jgi:hypothetical protein
VSIYKSRAISQSVVEHRTFTQILNLHIKYLLRPLVRQPQHLDGFTVQISNYNAAYTWSGTATASGSVSISDTGLVTVTGVAPLTSSTVTITATRTGYSNGTATVTATSTTGAALTPTFGAPTTTTRWLYSLNYKL